MHWSNALVLVTVVAVALSVWYGTRALEHLSDRRGASWQAFTRGAFAPRDAFDAEGWALKTKSRRWALLAVVAFGIWAFTHPG